MDPEALKLSEEIESSRKEIEKLQERVRQLVARRGKRAELVKASQIVLAPDLAGSASSVTRSTKAEPDDLGKELTVEEGLAAFKSTPMSEVRLIAFKHGAVIFLLSNERTLTVRMDDRGPKPLLDLLTANEPKGATLSAQSLEKRERA